MNYGVLYLNQGTKCIIRLLVSIHSLRKVYSGGITVIQVGELPLWATKILVQMNVDILPLPDDGIHPLVRKSMMGKITPYDLSLFIDADTLVVKPIDIIWKKMAKYDFAVYNFAGWKSNGGMISGRMRGFKAVCSEEEIKDAINYGVAVNTGIFAFKRDSAFLAQWEELTVKGKENNCSRIPDEIACQILLPKFKVKILPPEWGVSVKYSEKEHRDKAVIIHYHGMKHCIPEYDLCRLWEAEYMELVNKFAIRELRMPWGDKRLGRFQEREGLNKTEIKENADTSKDITYVTAVNSAYLDKLKKNYPLWMKVKGIRKKPFIVFARSDCLNKLDFLNKKRTTVIPWDYGLKESYSEREGMLTAFVFGVAEHVKTPYWCKIDADATPKCNRFEWDKEAFDCDIAGHRWGYTKSKDGYKHRHFLNILDDWWLCEILKLKSMSCEHYLFPANLPYNKRYSHKRIASFLCLHKTAFSLECCKFAGERLPIPSHDTFMFYVAKRLDKKVGYYNLRKYFSA